MPALEFDKEILPAATSVHRKTMAGKLITIQANGPHASCDRKDRPGDGKGQRSGSYLPLHFLEGIATALMDRDQVRFLEPIGQRVRALKRPRTDAGRPVIDSGVQVPLRKRAPERLIAALDSVPFASLPLGPSLHSDRCTGIRPVLVALAISRPTPLPARTVSIYRLTKEQRT
jgi:hypothetical protein